MRYPTKTIQILFLLFIFCSINNVQSQATFEEGQVILSLKNNVFPVYPPILGVFISFNEQLKIIKVDSTVILKYKNYSKEIEYIDTTTSNLDVEKCQDPELNSLLSNEFIQELSNIDAFYIGYLSSNSNYEDTTYHAVHLRTDIKWMKSQTKYSTIILKYKSKISPIEVAKKLEKYDFIDFANANEILNEF